VLTETGITGALTAHVTATALNPLGLAQRPAPWCCVMSRQKAGPDCNITGDEQILYTEAIGLDSKAEAEERDSAEN